MSDQHKIVTRVHRSVLAAPERRLLNGLAARLPDAVTSDHLTLFGIAGALLCGISYAASTLSPAFLWLASLGLAANWFGDSLDGTLARHRGRERPHYGFFIDHTTDIASQVFIFLGLGASPYLRFDIACLALMSYWLAALYSFIRAIATTIFQISYGGIGPTEIRLGLIAYNLALLALGPVVVETPYGPLSPLDLLCAAIFVAVFLAFLILVWREGRRLAALESLPAEPRHRPASRV